MKALKIVIVVLSAVVLLGVAGFLVMGSAAQKGVQSLVYENVDMAAVADGTYMGEADAGMVFVKVCVTVLSHRLTDIDIVAHKNGMGEKAEAITASMIDKNTVDVDVVSGATMSSKTIKSAVSQALSEGIN